MQKPLIAGFTGAVTGAATALLAVTAPAAAAAAPRQVLYVGGSGTGIASVVDPATGNELNTISGSPSVGDTGRIAFDAGKGLAYLADGDRALDVVDVNGSRIVKTVQVGTTPLNLALAPGGGRVYTSDFSSNTVSVVDTASYAVVATVSVGRSPTDVAVNPDGKHAYAVASEINMNPHGNVSVIDTATNTVTATIEVGGNPKAIAVTPDGKHAYVTNSATTPCRYVTAEAAGAQPLIANRTAAGPWENFTGLR